ncbi:hypothetical protein XENOCAPTIV_027792, partial [Xenoophorus captivus]
DSIIFQVLPDSQAAAAWKAGMGSGALSRALSCSTSALKESTSSRDGRSSRGFFLRGLRQSTAGASPRLRNTVEASLRVAARPRRGDSPPDVACSL